MPTSPSAPMDSSWTTPAVPQAPVVGAVPPTHEVAGPATVVQPADIGVLGDPTSGTVAGATAAAEAYYTSHEQLTHPQGSALGSLMPVSSPPLDPGAAPGEAEPWGALYDPPRGY